jgi:hypothetical protein
MWTYKYRLLIIQGRVIKCGVVHHQQNILSSPWRSPFGPGFKCGPNGLSTRLYGRWTAANHCQNPDRAYVTGVVVVHTP